MKRAICAITALLLVFSLCGCSGSVPDNIVFTRADVSGTSIGVLENSAAVAYAENRGSVRYYATGDELTAALKAGTVDCAVADESVAGSLLKGEHRLTVLEEPLISAGFCFAVAKENADLTKAVNSALSNLRASGTLQSIIDGYFYNTGYFYESPADIDRSAGTLTLAVGSDFPPYKMTGEDDDFTGLDVDVARAVCDDLGLGLEIIEAKGESLVSCVMYGKAHFALGGLYASKENSEKVDFTDSYTTCTQIIIVRK